jgi:lipopolysaccharide export system permease protein
LVLSQYVRREIAKPLGVILAVLVVLFASYSAARYLADAAGGGLPGHAVASLVGLKVLIALEVLLPIALYLSTVLGLGRMYADSEMTALAATGVSLTLVLRVVLWLAGGVALVVAVLSLYLRPWAYREIDRVKVQARAEFDLARFEARRFHRLPQGERVAFANEVRAGGRQAHNVFVQRDVQDGVQVVWARDVEQGTDRDTGASVLVFRDGEAYQFPKGARRAYVARFRQFTLPLRIEPEGERYRRKGASSLFLLGSTRPGDVSELQWRLSTPVSAVLLSLLAIPLSRTVPRRGKYAKILAAAVLYAAYYNLCLAAKTWVEQGVVPRVPGLWWAHALFAGIAVALLWRSDMGFHLRRR